MKQGVVAAGAFLLLSLVALPGRGETPSRAAQPVRRAPRQAVYDIPGHLSARLRGEQVPIAFVGDVKKLEVLLEPRDADSGQPTIRAMTDQHCNFTLRKVPPGEYLFRVRVPGPALDEDNAELYRCSISVKPNKPPAAILPQLPFLSFALLGPGGDLAKADGLSVAITRVGGKLDLGPLHMQFTKGPPAALPAQLQANGLRPVMLRISGKGDNTQWGWSWRVIDGETALIPVVEEDAPVKYYLRATLPNGRGSTYKFSGNRNKTPDLADIWVQPSATLAGAVRLEGVTAPLQVVSIAVAVLEPEDLEPIYETTTQPRADGTFSLGNLPGGLVRLTATVTGRVGEQANVDCRGRQCFFLRDGEKRADAQIAVRAAGPAELTPGEIEVTVLDSQTRKPLDGARVELIPEGDEESEFSSDTNLDGRFTFDSVRARPYFLRVTDPTRQDHVTEVKVSPEEIRRGVRKTVTPLPRA